LKGEMEERRAIPVLVGPFSGPVHGVSVINARLAAAMTAQGLTMETIDLAPPSARRGLTYHAIRAWRVLRGLGRIALSRNRRYVMSVDGGGGLAYNLVLAAIARLTGQPMAFYHHSTRYVLADSAGMRLLTAMAGPGAPHIFCSAKMAALFQGRYGGARRVLLVGNTAWVEEMAPGEGSPQGVRLGFLSTLTEGKGLRRVLNTLQACQGLNAELLLAGPVVDEWARRTLKEARAEFGSALEVQGVLTGDEKAKFYRGLDVFLFPSLYPHETQSLVVPEALAAGTPVVATDHRFVGEILGACGLLVPPQEDFAARAAAFIAAGGDPAVRSARRSAALARYQALRREAEGEVDRLIAWACGKAP
jgi:glycosyltransferase involved in cell wall biosynthesis